MKRMISLIVILLFGIPVFAQEPVEDSVIAEKVIITKDSRLDILGKFQSDLAKTASRFGKGYRLFVLKTNDREYAMKVRTYLLQNYPEDKVIMTYQAPFIKMKFGDFVDKQEAEKVKKQITKDGVVIGGIYIVPDTIELKPDKNGQNDLKL